MNSDADRTARAQADSVCYDYAKQIAESMWATHYKADAPHWESCDSLMGVLSQISNMMCGLSSAPADSVTAPAGWRLVPIEPSLNQEWDGKEASSRVSTMAEACKIYKAMFTAA